MVAAFLIIFILFLISEIEKFKVSYLDYYKYFSNYLDILRAKVEIAIPVSKSYNTSDVIIERISNFISSEVQKIPTCLMSIFSILSIIVLIPMLVLFMLFAADKSINVAFRYLRNGCCAGKIYIRTDYRSFFIGVMSVIFLSALGVNFALIIGIVAGIANTIPYLGPLVGVVLAITVGIVNHMVSGFCVSS